MKNNGGPENKSNTDVAHATADKCATCMNCCKNDVETQNLEMIGNHIEKNRVPTDDTTTRCVDGRYGEDEATGAIAFPGGALGISMVLVNLGYTPAHAHRYVADFLISKGMRYDWHTDTHAEHDEDCAIGCGHCNAAIQQAKKYNIDGEKIQKLLTIVEEEHQDSCVTLTGDHSEEAILVVTSTDYTVRPKDPKTGKQVFIYDKTRHEALLRDFVAFLAEKRGVMIKISALLEESEKQLNTTLGLLGSSKGKPIYTVDCSDENRVQIEKVGDAPIL